MFRRLREFGPSLLVPLAWAFVIAAHLDFVSNHTVFIAHVVMAILLGGFAVTGRKDMREGVLGVWWYVIAVGCVVTLSGLIGFQIEAASAVLWGIGLGGWMLLPAVGFAYTGQRVARGAWIYVGGTVACLVGVALYAAGVVGGSPPFSIGGLVLVGVGQTAGILDATLRY
jgi:hypothetical protein